MEGFGIEKLAMILLIVMVLFGGKRIPEIGASLGKGIREFKRGIKDVGESLNDDALPPVRPAASLPASTAPAESVVYDPDRGAPKRLFEN
ncbi:MAG: twin-arginine translocase TatA/TatE family subunit [Gemmatimonadota bacterium]|nr:twin-arginine translocase TatA/TatE family subunit [Gemmatimonadota bacterium]